MGMPQLVPLRIPPGVFRSGTEYQAKGRWYDTNLVRWYDRNVLGPVLGWLTKSLATVTGKARAIITWRDDSGSRWAIIGTHSGLYVMDDGGQVKDITPTSPALTVGRTDATVLLGYGEGKYGFWGYGTPRPDTGNVLPATVWDLDIWGQYPIGCSHDDGKILMWQLDFSTPTKAAAITNAPTACYGVVVAPQRFIVALGAGGNPRKLQWSDQGAETIWTPSATNQAGSLEIPQGRLICARAVGDQVLVLTDTDAHVMDYIGLPFVFSRRKVGDACGAISKKCIAVSGPLAVWWSKSGFWLYDGTARPLPCSVWDDLRRNLTVAQQSKVSAFHNARDSEFWWLFPYGGATEITNYVFYSYKYDYWGWGTLTRLCGSDPGVFVTPFLVGADGTVYDHEIGASYSGSVPYARSGPVEIGNGDRLMHAVSLIPDEKTVGDVTVSFRTRQYPNGSEMALGSTSLDSSGKADVRFSARQVELVVNGARSTDWRWGEPRLAVQAAGRR